MAQFARPSGTVEAGGWTAVGDSTLHECTDEVTPNGDTDYAEADDTDTTMKLNLSAVTDPVSSSGHVVRVNICDYNGGGQPERFSSYLYDGTTLIATAFSNVATSAHPTYTTHEYTLTTEEADAIENYDDLRIWVEMAALQTGEMLRCSQCELEVPDPVADLDVAVDDDGSVEDYGGGSLTPIKAESHSSGSLADYAQAILSLIKAGAYDELSLSEYLSAALDLLKGGAHDLTQLQDQTVQRLNLLKVHVYDTS